MRRLAAMSVHPVPPECPQQASTGLGEILPPALQASLKVGSMACCPDIFLQSPLRLSIIDGSLGDSELSGAHGWKGMC